MGGVHWWQSRQELDKATAEYQTALNRFKEAGYEEKPAHQVTLTQPFYLGKFTVTQAQYQQVTGSGLSQFLRGYQAQAERACTRMRTILAGTGLFSNLLKMRCRQSALRNAYKAS